METTPRDYLTTLKVVRNTIPTLQNQIRLMEKELAYIEAKTVEGRIHELGGDIKAFGANEEARTRATTLLLDSTNEYLTAWENLGETKLELAQSQALRDNCMDELTVWKYEIRERYVQVAEADAERDISQPEAKYQQMMESKAVRKRMVDAGMINDFPVQQ